MDGMKLSSRGQFTWSVVFIVFWAFFFLVLFFSPARCFFSWASLLIFIFLGYPWPHIIFWQLLPTPPTYLLPCLPPTHLPPSPCFFLPHSLLFRSPPHLVLEKQGQFELALGFSSQGFEFSQLQELAKGTFRSVKRGGEERSLQRV